MDRSFKLLLFYIVSQLSGAYFLGPPEITWEAAEAYCVSKGTHLASMHSDADMAAVAALCRSTGDTTGCHMGLRKVQGLSGPWSWTDGSAINYGFNNNDGAQPITISPTWPWVNSAASDGSGGSELCTYVATKDNYAFEDIDCAGRYNNYGLNPAICNGDGQCDMQMVDAPCSTDEACPDCMHCCQFNTCQLQPTPAHMVAPNDINGIGTDPAGDQSFVSIKKKPTEYPNLFGYILFVGVVLFILINNCFIGYWCVCKKGTRNQQYAKCDMITVNDE